MLFPSVDSLTFFCVLSLLFASQPIQLQKHRPLELHETSPTTMCLLNFTPLDDEEPDFFQFPRGRPRLAWAIPISMSELGASLQAIANTEPQTTTLRLSHRFGDTSLSKLPQELLDQIIGHVENAARKDCLPTWYQDSVCWQGTCLREDHYTVHNELVQELWQKIFIDKHYGPTCTHGKQDSTVNEATKVEMVRDWMSCDTDAYEEEKGWSLHFDAQIRWIHRTCTCPEQHATTGGQLGSFNTLQKVTC
jgi:hypothetical protein